MLPGVAVAELVLHYDERPDPDRWCQRIFLAVTRHLEARGVCVRLDGSGSFETRSRDRPSHVVPLSDSFAVLQDDRSGQYRVLDCHDWTVPKEMRWFLEDRRCRLILKCQYKTPPMLRRRVVLPGPDSDLHGARRDIVRPWTYFDTYWPVEQDRHAALRSAVPTDRRMYFRGEVTGDWSALPIQRLARWKDARNARQPVVETLRDRGILDAGEDEVPYARYAEEMADHRIALSLPGNGDFCHRDVEALGIGACLLRPRLRNQCHEELREDFHYVSVDTDTLKDSPAVVAARIAERYESVIDAPDLLASVARNGAEWYDRNVRFPACIDLTTELLLQA
jgi:hypothetical protein